VPVTHAVSGKWHACDTRVVYLERSEIPQAVEGELTWYSYACCWCFWDRRVWQRPPTCCRCTQKESAESTMLQMIVACQAQAASVSADTVDLSPGNCTNCCSRVQPHQPADTPMYIKYMSAAYPHMIAYTHITGEM
jgi:hypothetical protein